MIRRLIANETDIDDKNRKGTTALIMACSAEKHDAVKLLLTAGASTDVKDDLGYDAYHSAMFYGDFRGVTGNPYDKIMQLLKAKTSSK